MHFVVSNEIAFDIIDPFITSFSMILPEVNLVAVCVSVVFTMLLGMVWYSKSVFGTAWMQLSGLTDTDFANVNMKRSFGIGIVASAIMAYMVNAVVMMTGASSVSEVLTVAFYVWLATVIPGELHGMAWEKRPFKLLLINASNALLTYLIAVFVVQNWAF